MQFKFNNEIFELIVILTDTLKNTDVTSKGGNKLIKMVGRSVVGWNIVNEHKTDSYCQ